jgi:ribose transport system substrate-binding protein
MKQRRVRAFSAVALGTMIVALVVPLGGASFASTTTYPLKPLNVDYANITNANASLAALGTLIQGDFTQVGDTVKVYDNNADPQTTINNVSLMEADNPDVIMDWNPVAAEGSSLQAEFAKFKVPCIAVNIAIPGCPLFNLPEKALGIAVGNQLAAAMKAKGWTGANTTVLIGQNAPVGDATNAIVREAYRAISIKIKGFKKVPLSAITATTTRIAKNAFQINTTDQVDVSYTTTLSVLQNIPKKENVVFYGITDETTQGALQAFQRDGRGKNNLVAGNGGDAEGLGQLSTNSQWVAESDPFVPQWGEYLDAMAHALADGITVPTLTQAPTVVLTKANLTKYYLPGSSSPRSLPALGATDQYLVQTGVFQKFGNVTGVK